MHVWERAAPEGVEALEWFLLTTLPVASLADAEQVLEWYRLRWRIEDWHRMLKSGCKVEYLGHRTGQRIERAVTIKAVIAWRLAAMTLLGRETPELPSEVFFTQIQLAGGRLGLPGAVLAQEGVEQAGEPAHDSDGATLCCLPGGFRTH